MSDAVISSTSDESVLISQGAEARVYLENFLGRKIIRKERFPKLYRHPELDRKISNKRVCTEVKCLLKCRSSGLQTPAVYFVDTIKNCIYFEYIQGETLKERIRREAPRGGDGFNFNNLGLLATRLGVMLAKMHSVDVVHGDLTTSNVLIRVDNSLVMIDFGLSSVSTLAEDKAVDLYVLEKALLSTHANSKDFFDEILNGYASFSNAATSLLLRLEQVRMRGRKRLMIG